jgi:hypothetical protein
MVKLMSFLLSAGPWGKAPRNPAVRSILSQIGKNEKKIVAFFPKVCKIELGDVL